MNRLRILLLVPDCNPEGVSMPYVTYSHAAALAQLHDVTLVVGSPSEDRTRRAKAPFRTIEVVPMPLLDRIYAWSLRKIFKYNFDTQVLTAFGYPFCLAFEWRAWRQLRRRIFAGEFDVVLRLLPMTPVLPSPFAFFLRKGPIPFVIGPLNGGLPWPPGFSQLENQKEWISNLRNLYRYLPFARSTYRHAAAIIVASSQTYSEFTEYSDKLFFVPEPGIARSLCYGDSRSPKPGAQLELIFAGGLVPRKACDLALRAAAPLLRSGLARFTVVGDGPERNRLEQLTRSLGIEEAVLFCGWLSHAEVLKHLRSADVFVFPSLRDNGAGVVFEALGTGAVPVVADFGGPGDIVHAEVGYKVPLTTENDIVAQMEKILMELAHNRDRLEQLRRQGMAYVRECLTWDAKAQAVSRVLHWVVQRGPMPDLPPPKMLHLEPVTVKRLVGPLVRRTLSPRMFQFVRFGSWCLSFYFPRLVTSWFVKRTPQIRSFGAAPTPSHLAKRLQHVNVLAPTKFCRVMTKYGSDKGRAHNYTTVYSALFRGRCDQPLRIFELGLGTNSPDVPSTMGVFGVPGASLRGWRELFPQAFVYGADIDRGILFQEDRIKTFYCDQLDRSSIRELWSHPDLQAGVDIIIEDGLHTFEANVSFLEESLDQLRPGGIYICEDIMWNRVGEWCDRLETSYSEQYPTYEFAFAVLPDRGNQANNLLVIRRGAN